MDEEEEESLSERKRQTSIGMRLERRNILMKNKRMRTEVRNKILMRRRVYQRGRGRPRIGMRLESRASQ